MNKKEQILASALELLTERGVHNTPMSAIAKEAGTGMGTIYNYFATKEILINEIYVAIKQKEMDVFVPFLSENAIKPQFEKYLTSIIAFFIENGLFFKFMEQLQASPIITEESKNIGLLSIKPVFELIEKGKQDGIIKDFDTNELLQFVGGSILSFLRNHSVQNQTNNQVIPNYIKMTWDAIKA